MLAEEERIGGIRNATMNADTRSPDNTEESLAESETAFIVTQGTLKVANGVLTDKGIRALKEMVTNFPNVDS